MTSILALLCAISLSPAECTAETAVDSIPLGTADNEIACAMSAQMTLAQLAVRADADHRWKIVCSPEPPDAENVAGVNDP